MEALGAPRISGREDLLPHSHFEIKFRGPDNVVFDLSDAAWPGSDNEAQRPVGVGRLRRCRLRERNAERRTHGKTQRPRKVRRACS